MNKYLQVIKDSRKIQVILLVGFIVQLIFCYTSIGYFHPDQYFQIIEFSSLQLNDNNAANSVWELKSNIRPTLQVYLFSSFKLCCKVLSINDPFTQLTILRFFQGFLFFIVFNLIAFYYNNKKPATIFISVLLLLNFSWVLPYSRTLFSSEMLSALVFFPTIVYFHKQYLSNKNTLTTNLIIGILLAFSFYLRFQIAFAIIGFGIWILFFEKKIKLTAQLLLGFVIGVFVNLYLDYKFYNELVCTPYLYFKTNLLDGVAASFGEKNFTYYIGVLLAVIAVPPISILLFYKFCKVLIVKIKHPIVISSLLFLVGHFLVGHKEERFLFTLINIIPIIFLIDENPFYYFFNNIKWNRIIKTLIISSLLINFTLLILLSFNPYSQSIQFLKKIQHNFQSNSITKIYSFNRTPLQTESLLPLVFYSNGVKNIDAININNIDSITSLNQKTIWLSATFNDIKTDLKKIDSLGYKPQFYSSLMLWNLNLFLQKKSINTLNDIWVLYKLEK